MLWWSESIGQKDGGIALWDEPGGKAIMRSCSLGVKTIVLPEK